MELEYISRACGSEERIDIRMVEYIVCDDCADALPDVAGVLGTCYHEYAEWECELCGTVVYGTGTVVVSLDRDLQRHSGTKIHNGEDDIAATYAALNIGLGHVECEPMSVSELPRTNGIGQTVLECTRDRFVIRDDNGTAISAHARVYPRY